MFFTDPFLLFKKETMMSLESDFQAGLIKEIKERLPGCFVIKNDEQYIQGIPDLTILYRQRWAILEVKRRFPMSSREYQPNQEYYLDLLDEMGCAAMICPENKEEVLAYVQRSLTS